VDKRVAVLTQTGDYVGPELARSLVGAHRLVLHAPTAPLVGEVRSGGGEVEVVEATDVDLRTAEGNALLVERVVTDELRPTAPRPRAGWPGLEPAGPATRP